jgi:NADPH:quinone reductase-like Zn-dependent oxidoreductase
MLSEQQQGKAMSNNLQPEADSGQAMVYQIRVKSHLGADWTDWFEGLTITREDNGDTLLTGPVIDQAALHGLLKKVRDLGMPLVSMNQVQFNEVYLEERKFMKAILFPKYGSPDVLEFTDVEKPTPNENQVLIKVIAASANPLDWHRMRGEPFIARMGEGYRKPKNSKLGADVAGWVEAVGKNVTEFKPGDKVFGAIGSGSFAEYACAREKSIVLKPGNLSFEAAAAAPVAAYTALQGLRDTGKIRPGQKILVNGAAGGVGTFAVQIAKSYRTEVTGVCSTRNLDMVRSIGADHVVDYTREDFTRNGQYYDLIYDAIGNRSIFAYRRALKPNGICVIAGFTSLSLLFAQMVLGPLVSKFGDRKVGGMGISHADKGDLLVIKELLEMGKVVSVIDRCYPLSETAEAIRYLEKGHARGKVIIKVDEA